MLDHATWRGEGWREYERTLNKFLFRTMPAPKRRNEISGWKVSSVFNLGFLRWTTWLHTTRFGWWVDPRLLFHSKHYKLVLFSAEICNHLKAPFEADGPCKFNTLVFKNGVDKHELRHAGKDETACVHHTFILPT